MASSSSYYPRHAAGTASSRSSAAAAASSSVASASSSSRLSLLAASSSASHQQQEPFAAALRDQEHEHQPPILRWSNDAHSGGVGERLFAAHYSLDPTAATNPNHLQRQHQQQTQHHLSSDYPYPASLSYKSTSYMDPSGRSVSAHIHNNGSSSRGGLPPPSMSDMGMVPSLDYDSSSVAESSVNTFQSGQGPPNRTLEEGSDGLLLVPPTPTTTTTVLYDCAFSFLGCRYIAANDEREWKTHVLSHFFSHLPPRKVSCPMPGCDWGFEDTDGGRAWDIRMNHVAAHHRAGQRLDLAASAGPNAAWIDSNLFRYLWQKRIIDDAAYQDLSSGGAVVGPRTATMGTQAERRRERREHHARPMGR
ncbi:hypothetical protein IWZ00DRAFT_47027 [Phyllosticta capitalensis]|uniref:uncharacterized protein n=1 Tax=Phyllosticta capitalensis TaxID=121624 RepID=UPI00312E399B